MAVNWGLAESPAGPLDLLRAAGQRQMERVQLQQAEDRAKREQVQFQREEQQFARQQQQDATRQQVGGMIASGDLQGGRAAAYSSGDLDLGQHLDQQLTSMKKAEREEAGRQAGMLRSALFDVKQLAPEMRAAGLEQAKANLRAQGLDDEDFAIIGDASDAALDQAIGFGQTLEDKVKQFNDNRDYGFKVERAKAEDNNAQASRAVTMRGQDISAANSMRSDARADRRAALSDLRADRREALQFGKVNRQTETALRKEFDNLPEVKNFRTINGQGAQIFRLAKNPSPQNDIAMIFSYMKMLDPTSVVREGEFATAQNAAGIPDRIRNLYNKAQNGERLNPDQRVGIVSSANDIKTSARQVYNDRTNQFRSYAADYGAGPDRVASPSRNKAKASGATTIAPGFTIERVR